MVFRHHHRQQFENAEGPQHQPTLGEQLFGAAQPNFGEFPSYARTRDSSHKYLPPMGDMFNGGLENQMQRESQNGMQREHYRHHRHHPEVSFSESHHHRYHERHERHERYERQDPHQYKPDFEYHHHTRHPGVHFSKSGHGNEERKEPRDHERHSRSHRRERGEPESYAPEVTPGGEHPGSKLAHSLIKAALHTAHNMNTVGRCASGVQEAFRQVGMHDLYGSGNAAQMGGPMIRSGHFVKVEHPQPGDVGVRQWAPHVVRAHHGHQWGDAFVVVGVNHGRITQANDHIQSFDPHTNYYSQTQFYRPVS